MCRAARVTKCTLQLFLASMDASAGVSVREQQNLVGEVRHRAAELGVVLILVVQLMQLAERLATMLVLETPRLALEREPPDLVAASTGRSLQRHSRVLIVSLAQCWQLSGSCIRRPRVPRLIKRPHCP